MKINRIATLLSLVLVTVAISGCASRRAAVVKNTFLLEAKRTGATAQPASQAVLTVQPFSIAPAFQRNAIVFRVDENEYEADFYSEYFVPPAVMMTNLTRQWLAESGVLKQVLSPNSTVMPTHLLDGHVRKMFADQTNPEQPKAVLEITFFLVRKQKRDETIIFHRTYTATHEMESSNPRRYVAAQNAALTEILKSMEKDVAENL